MITFHTHCYLLCFPLMFYPVQSHLIDLSHVQYLNFKPFKGIVFVNTKHEKAMSVSAPNLFKFVLCVGWLYICCTYLPTTRAVDLTHMLTLLACYGTSNMVLSWMSTTVTDCLIYAPASMVFPSPGYHPTIYPANYKPIKHTCMLPQERSPHLALGRK